MAKRRPRSTRAMTRAVPSEACAAALPNPSPYRAETQLGAALDRIWPCPSRGRLWWFLASRRTNDARA